MLFLISHMDPLCINCAHLLEFQVMDPQCIIGGNIHFLFITEHGYAWLGDVITIVKAWTLVFVYFIFDFPSPSTILSFIFYYNAFHPSVALMTYVIRIFPYIWLSFKYSYIVDRFSYLAPLILSFLDHRHWLAIPNLLPLLVLSL